MTALGAAPGRPLYFPGVGSQPGEAEQNRELLPGQPAGAGGAVSDSGRRVVAPYRKGRFLRLGGPVLT